MLYHRCLVTHLVSKRQETRPNWAEISDSALRHNFLTLQNHVGKGVTICAVVKCDAYGHGALECARTLEEIGASWFGITSTDEGILLREGGIRGRILIMCGIYRGEEEEALHNSLTPAVFRLEDAQKLSRAAERLRLERVPIHLKIDTGMARLGIPLADLESFAEGVKALPRIELEGVFSHLASSEVIDDEATAHQVERFEGALRTLAGHGLQPRFQHLANTGGVVCRPNTHHNFVRPGLALFGYTLPIMMSDGSLAPNMDDLDLQRVLTWKTHVLAVRDVPVGQGIGYNGAYVTQKPTRVATVSVGYGDGLSRKLFGRGEVLIRGARAPIIGRISMDLTQVDVTAVRGVAIGDQVVLIGRDGEERISAWELARRSDTVVYETLCNLTKRVPRRYVE